MLPRRLRLSRAAFTIRGPEMRLASPHFSVSIREGQAGCGAVISKKTEKSSVGRHKLKRRILTAVRPWCGETRSITIYARAGSPSLPYSVLRVELTELLTKLLGRSQVR